MLPLPEKRSHLCQSRDGSLFFRELLIFLFTLTIVFTNKVSHEAKRKALLHARSRNIPIHLVHSCGVSSLRDCLFSS